jgi:hypothetical protein
VAIGFASLAGMVSLGVGLEDQLVGQFTKSGMFDAINVMPVRSDRSPSARRTRPRRAPRLRPKRRGPDVSENAGRADRRRLEGTGGADQVKDVYPEPARAGAK